MSQSLTYVFCLVRSTRKPQLTGVPLTLPGAREVRLLAAGGSTWLVTAAVPAKQYDEAALAAGIQDLNWVARRAMAHEAVVEHFLGARAVLPMQLFTLFTSDERALEHVARQRRRIERSLARIDRHLEWGLRLTFDEKGAQAEASAPVARRRTAASGADYLARKRDQLDRGRTQVIAARAAANRVYRALAREAAGARRRTGLERSAPGSRLLLDAAFLVPSRRAGTFRALLRKQVKAMDAGNVVVSLTGPWPPYNFV